MGSSRLDTPARKAASGPLADCLHLICDTDKADVVVRISGTSVCAPEADISKYSQMIAANGLRRTYFSRAGLPVTSANLLSVVERTVSAA